MLGDEQPRPARQQHGRQFLDAEHNAKRNRLTVEYNDKIAKLNAEYDRR